MKTIIAISFLLLIINATMVAEKRIVTKNVINQLAKSRFGKNVFTAIQLELSSKNTENIVNRILQLLRELDDTLRGQFESTSAELERKQDWCDSELHSLKEQADNKDARLAELQIEIPTLEALINDKTQEQSDQQAAQDSAELLIRELQEQDRVEREAHLAQVQHVNNMIDALKEARRLIAQLQRGSFLQKSSNILAELKSHHTAAAQKLSPAHKSIFNVLMNMSQNVDILADQSKVSSVITIIDDLLLHQAETIEFLNNSEVQRQREVAQKQENFEQQRDVAHSHVLRLTAELSQLGTSYNQAVNDRGVLIEDLKLLKERIESTYNACQDSVKQLNDSLTEIAEEVGIVKKVIEIFESNAIQDIKSVVDSLEYSE